MNSLGKMSRREFMCCMGMAGATAGLVACVGPGVANGPDAAPLQFQVMGLDVLPEMKGTPLEKANQTMLADFARAHPAINLVALETPPDVASQILVDLAADTAPDVWAHDSSNLAQIVEGGYILDMRRLFGLAPGLNEDRFFPEVMAIHRWPDGSIYGLPDDYSPIVIFYNPVAFQRAGIDPPSADWSWYDMRALMHRLTLDGDGRNRNDHNFDDKNIVQWGYRIRKFPGEWIYRVWENNADVVAADFGTVRGYLDSEAAMEAIQFVADLLLVDQVAPPPSSLDRMTEALGFNDRYLKGEFAGFDGGHWELVGIRSSPQYAPERVAVIRQPGRSNHSTIIYERGWVIRANLPERLLPAATAFVDAATGREHQDTKPLTGIAVSANRESALAAVARAANPAMERIFLDATVDSRIHPGARISDWPAIETMLGDMMERVLKRAATVKEAIDEVVQDIERELLT